MLFAFYGGHVIRAATVLCLRWPCNIYCVIICLCCPCGTCYCVNGGHVTPPAATLFYGDHGTPAAATFFMVIMGHLLLLLSVCAGNVNSAILCCVDDGHVKSASAIHSLWRSSDLCGQVTSTVVIKFMMAMWHLLLIFTVCDGHMTSAILCLRWFCKVYCCHLAMWPLNFCKNRMKNKFTVWENVVQRKRVITTSV
jgi:hypothetical protein